MKRRNLHPLLVVLLILTQLACNYDSVNLFAEPTATAAPPTPTFTLPPTNTAPPPPTATFTLPPPPPTQPAAAVEPTLPPTPAPTNTPFPTAKPTVRPQGGARFVGSFAGGVLVFRVNDAGAYVTLKEITLEKVKCGNKEINKHMTFETISYFTVENNEFYIEDEQATLSGVFDTPTTAHGSLTVNYKLNKYACTLGPVNWTASADD
jgi:hypothetical protein